MANPTRSRPTSATPRPVSRFSQLFFCFDVRLEPASAWFLSSVDVCRVPSHCALGPELALQPHELHKPELSSCLWLILVVFFHRLRRLQRRQHSVLCDSGTSIGRLSACNFASRSCGLQCCHCRFARSLVPDCACSQEAPLTHAPCLLIHPASCFQATRHVRKLDLTQGTPSYSHVTTMPAGSGGFAKSIVCHPADSLKLFVASDHKIWAVSDQFVRFSLHVALR